LSQELSDLDGGGYLMAVNSQTDQQLLHEYMESGSEAAFCATTIILCGKF